MSMRRQDNGDSYEDGDEVKGDSGHQAINWPFTVYAAVDHSLEDRRDILLHEAIWPDVRYMVVGREICPTTGTPHLQCYLQLKKKKRFNQVIEMFKSNFITDVHIERQRAKDPKKARDYCKEDGDWAEWGEFTGQGKRSDLHTVAEGINEGTFSSISDVINQYPVTYVRNHAGIQKLWNQKKPPQKERDMPMIFYWVGPTRSGKTESMKTFLSQTLKIPTTEWYWAKNDVKDKQWWQGYHGQKVIIWDEFRGQYPISDMLRILDRNPIEVDVKGDSTPMTSSIFCFTANHPLMDLYQYEHAEVWKAWCARFEEFGRNMKTYLPKNQAIVTGSHKRKLDDLVEAYEAYQERSTTPTQRADESNVEVEPNDVSQSPIESFSDDVRVLPERIRPMKRADTPIPSQVLKRSRSWIIEVDSDEEMDLH